jgi:hypothetical protein
MRGQTLVWVSTEELTTTSRTSLLLGWLWLWLGLAMHKLFFGILELTRLSIRSSVTLSECGNMS